MAQPVQLVLGVHLHQPVGNIPAVLEHSYQHAYLPFLETLAPFPAIKLVWHCTGDLFLWLRENHPEYLEMLRSLVRDDRLEVLTGGMYEPIFPIIPRRDRQEQIRRLSRLVQETMGVAPTGLWLAERVWEPALAADLAEAGVKYVCLDDYHFFASGIPPAKLDGYFTAEELDRAVSVFPISEKMRYLIPWAENRVILQELAAMQSAGRRLSVMLDDAEKFGAWPQTHEWVYEKKWLRDFFQMLSDHPEIVRTITLREYWESNPPSGRAALPVASYIEMGQWALPPERAQRFEGWRRRFESEGILEEIKPFLQGSIWRNFLVKYPEANYLQKRILSLSRAFDSEELRALPAYDHLLRAECNDVFWHGVFGGLYLPHLRHEAYRNLAEAQKGLERHLHGEAGPPVEIRREDLDLDGQDEFLLNHPGFLAVVAPAAGGAIQELTFKPAGFNLLATLARWKEKYHLSGLQSKVVRIGDDGQAAAAPPLSMDDLVFDTLPRWSGREKIFERLPAMTEVRAARDVADCSFFQQQFELEKDCEVGLPLRCRMPGFTLRKRYVPVPDQNLLEVVYDLSADGKYEGWLGVEWTLGLSGLDDVEKCVYPYFQRPEARGLAQDGGWYSTRGITVEDRRDGFMADFISEEGTAVRHYAVESVSLSIDTLEKTFQGFCFWLFFPIHNGKLRRSVSVRLTQIPKAEG